MKKLFNKGFTLLELLVVVLIIGILAGIALPQYKRAVAMSKFASIKNISQSIAESCEVFFLTHSFYPKKYSDLDITLPNVKRTEEGSLGFSIYFDKGGCAVWSGANTFQMLMCNTYINKVDTRLYIYFNNDPNHPGSVNKRLCYAFSLDKNDLPNKICQQETGKSANRASCTESYCAYTY